MPAIQRWLADHGHSGFSPEVDSDDAPRDSDDAPRDSDDAPRDSDDAPRDSDDAPRDSDDAPRDSDDAQASAPPSTTEPSATVATADGRFVSVEVERVVARKFEMLPEGDASAGVRRAPDDARSR